MLSGIVVFIRTGGRDVKVDRERSNSAAMFTTSLERVEFDTISRRLEIGLWVSAGLEWMRRGREISAGRLLTAQVCRSPAIAGESERCQASSAAVMFDPRRISASSAFLRMISTVSSTDASLLSTHKPK